MNFTKEKILFKKFYINQFVIQNFYQYLSILKIFLLKFIEEKPLDNDHLSDGLNNVFIFHYHSSDGLVSILSMNFFFSIPDIYRYRLTTLITHNI